MAAGDGNGSGAVAMIERVIAGRMRFLARPLALLRRFRSEQTAATAVEFAMVSLPFFALLYTIFEIAFLFVTGEALDTSVDAAARQLLTGQAQTSSGTTAINSMATFKQYALCPALPAIITCSQVQVNVAQVSSFSAVTLGAPVSNHVLDTSGWGYQPCASGQIMKVEAVYPVTALTSFWTSTYTVTVNGSSQRVLYTSSVFRCEPYQS
jgi:Flp pilus assembly protein TadG